MGVPSIVAVILAVYVLKTKKTPSSPTVSEPTIQEIPAEQEEKVRKYLEQARQKAKEIILEAKEESVKIRSEAEDYSSKQRSQISDIEQKVTDKLSAIDAKEKDIEKKLTALNDQQSSLNQEKEKLHALVEEAKIKLEQTSGLTKDEAKKLILELLDKDLTQDKGKRIREFEEDFKRESTKIAGDILVTAMRHGATDYVVEHTVSKVRLPDEEIKGRIIGKEGRNIRTFEEFTGVDLDLDSSPGDVIISSFDPVRREIAKISLEKLIADGRIQPARIEEIVQMTQKDVEQIMFKEGENLCHRVGVYNLPKDIIQMLGRFKYRFSYGQNMIEHTLEETRIGVAIANELKADVEVVKLGCLLHDIGKVVSDEEGTHVDLGVDLLRKFKIQDNIVACVAEHHEDKPFSSVESAIVNLADHISGARPGARSEDYESYRRRMQDLESAANSFDGVDKAFAVSAGREVRVLVKPEKIDDAGAAVLAREIAKKIELEQTYPGVVKIIVIREIRVSETAK